MTQQEIEQLANELISEIAATWSDSPHSSVEYEHGECVFVFVITFNGGHSTFRFNPKGTALKVIVDVVGKPTKAQIANENLSLIRTLTKRRLNFILTAIRRHFIDSLGQLPIIAAVVDSNAMLEPLTRDTKAQNELVELVIKGFGEKLRRRLTSKRTGRPKAFSEFEAYIAIMKLGGYPSQHQLAKALKTTTKTVLSWVRDKGFNSLADYLEAFHAEQAESHGEKPPN